MKQSLRKSATQNSSATCAGGEAQEENRYVSGHPLGLVLVLAEAMAIGAAVEWSFLGLIPPAAFSSATAIASPTPPESLFLHPFGDGGLRGWYTIAAGVGVRELRGLEDLGDVPPYELYRGFLFCLFFIFVFCDLFSIFLIII